MVKEGAVTRKSTTAAHYETILFWCSALLCIGYLAVHRAAGTVRPATPVFLAVPTVET